MTAFGVVPPHPPVPECRLCGDTGWLTYANEQGDAWDIPCPQGCPVPGLDDDVPP